jgi:hypothetical protein
MRHEAPQLTLPGLALEECTRVIDVAGPQLADTLEAERARGWRVVTMDMAGLSRWRVELERERTCARARPDTTGSLLNERNSGYLCPLPFHHETHVKKHCPLVR